MYHSHFVGQYDLGALTSDAANIRAALISAKRNTDYIDNIISKLQMNKHPEHFETILSELNLGRFWKTLRAMTTQYFILEGMAIDRALNFYEAATRSGFSRDDTRIGMVVAILSSTVRAGHQRSNPSSFTYAPCLMPGNYLTLENMEEMELGVLTETHKCFVIEHIKALCALSTANKNSINRITDKNRIRLFILDAARMWAASEQKQLVEFMTSDNGGRYKMIPSHLHHTEYNYYMMAYGQLDRKHAALNMTLFNTGWGRTQSFNLNYQNIVRAKLAVFN